MGNEFNPFYVQKGFIIFASIKQMRYVYNRASFKQIGMLIDFFLGATNVMFMNAVTAVKRYFRSYSTKYLNRTLETKNAWNLIVNREPVADIANIIMSDDAKDSSKTFLEKEIA